jgi:hypothetical protein
MKLPNSIALFPFAATHLQIYRADAPRHRHGGTAPVHAVQGWRWPPRRR